MNKNKSIYFHITGFIFEIGWFPGNEFKVFDLTLFEIPDSLQGSVTVYLFHLQILYFCILLGFDC